ncbi:hypothetical protein CLV81_0395 [Flagellimonas meridianipacifica]|uniref:Uncharacterized protein n=2 Tax=Flagellimonas meridianipacifica TaxID=1080225 RepID=A0A2T0MFP1_9FLAO|nr:hypothetical protein CLV81_0395 [Allomuricauda pacifica]
MTKIISHGLVVLFFMWTTTLFSHQPNQLTYTFTLDGETSTLTIRFTPKTLLDILEFVKPGLRDSSRINLNNYKDELCEYFGERILLNENSLRGKLSITEMNLIAHEAFITFVSDDSLDFSKGLHIKINCLADVYNRLENFVFIKHLKSTDRYALSKENRTAVWEFPDSASKKELGSFGIEPFWMVLLLSLIFMCLSFILIKRKSKDNEPKKIKGVLVKLKHGK